MGSGRGGPPPIHPFGGQGPGRGPMHGIAQPVARAEDVRAVVRRLWGYLGRRRRALILVTLLVACGAGLSLLTPYLTSVAIDRCIVPGRMADLARVVALMALAHVLASAATWAHSVAMVRVSQATLRDIRRDVFERMQALPLRFFDSRPHGEVMSHLTNDTEAINTALGQTVTQLVTSVLTLAGALAAMLALNWRLTLVCLATAPLALLIARAVAGAARQRYRERQQDLGALNGLIEETITGQRVVQAYGREQRALEEFDAANQRLRGSATAAGILSGMMGPSMNLTRNVSFAVLAAVGGWIALRGWATVGMLAAFVSYSHYLAMPLSQIAQLWGSVQTAIAGAERVFALHDEQPDSPDVPGATSLEDVRGAVSFEGVSFGYDPEQPVLRDVSFEAAAGQTIALVGPTGAGKTTIINLLTRFYDVDSGCIRVDGNDIREVARAGLRRVIGVVPQETFLFADTVRENIRYGRLEATDAEVEEAARLANATPFIRHLPHGFDTPLSEAGGTLSQGQRQLLAIARAILADPAILILDEATSSVDTRTELQTQEAMLRLMHGRTAFVIAHRLSTVRHADCILVVEGGRIVERGTQAELLAARGAYWRLHSLQYGGLQTIDEPPPLGATG